MNVFRKSATWIAQSYYLIAISIMKDVIEVAYKGYQFGFETSLNSIDWIDVITKAILALAVVLVFKKINESKEEIAQIKQDYHSHKKKFEDQNYMATLINLVRLESIVDSKMKFTREDFRQQHLQNMLNKEKDWMKHNLIHLQKHRPVQEIENMISEYYAINFSTLPENPRNE